LRYYPQNGALFGSMRPIRLTRLMRPIQ
jgi:hypothetical protein